MLAEIMVERPGPAESGAGGDKRERMGERERVRERERERKREKERERERERGAGREEREKGKRERGAGREREKLRCCGDRTTLLRIAIAAPLVRRGYCDAQSPGRGNGAAVTAEEATAQNRTNPPKKEWADPEKIG